MDMEFLHYAEVVSEDRRSNLTTSRLLLWALIAFSMLLFSSCAPLNPYQQGYPQQAGQTYARPEQVQLRETSRTVEEAQRLARDLDLLRYEINNLIHGF
jgi:hypothetical protein